MQKKYVSFLVICEELQFPFTEEIPLTIEEFSLKFRSHNGEIIIPETWVEIYAQEDFFDLVKE